MMKKLLVGTIAILLILIISAGFQWEKILNLKIFILAISGMIASYYQAEYNPFKKEASTLDHGTVNHIIWTIYVFQFFSLVEAFNFNYPHSMQFNFFSYLFICIAILGLLLRSWAYLTLGKFFTMHLETQNDHKLIENGPYKYLCHPSYTGAFILYVFNSFFIHAYYSAFFSIPFLIWAFTRRIKYEEIMLKEKLGDVYLEYSLMRYKLFPFIW